VGGREPLGKRIAKRVARNLAQFFKHFVVALLEEASDAEVYTHGYELCWCPENSDYCTCEERGMVPRGLLETEMCTCYGEHCTCPEH
jgi:hypothetical protein